MAKRVSLKGKGADLFFGDFPAGAEAEADLGTAAPVPQDGPRGAAHPPEASLPGPSEPASPPPTSPPPIASSTPPARAKASRRPSSRANGRTDTTLADAPPGVEASAIEAIRQVIKSPGREVSYVRLTPEEKARLSDIVYTYKRQGQKTSETEINRIALNYLLLDFHEHGEQSVLARVLAALQA